MTVHLALSSLYFLLLAQTAVCSNLITTDVTENAKMTCQNVKGTVYTVKSEMQCHHRCLRKERCEILNYKTSNAEDGSEKDNCEVLDVSSCNHICSKTTSNANWKTVIFLRQKEPNIKVYDSCKEIYEAKPGSASGVYDLRSGKHYCVMNNLQGCGQGGWTLAMKIDSTKVTFRYASSYWVADNIYNVEMGLKSFFSKEAKFASFNTLGFTKICLGMISSGVTRWTGISKTESSLLDLFKTGRYQSTNLGKAAWLGLVNGGSLQQNCNREGFNVKDDNNGAMGVRIGMISNEQDDCLSPDSFVGFGTTYSIACGISGRSGVRTMGYILIQ